MRLFPSTAATAISDDDLVLITDDPAGSLDINVSGSLS
jgi:hypothetical protein